MSYVLHENVYRPMNPNVEIVARNIPTIFNQSEEYVPEGVYNATHAVLRTDKGNVLLHIDQCLVDVMGEAGAVDFTMRNFPDGR